MASALQQGINAAKGGHTQQALDFLKDAIIEEPHNADVWVWIAAIIDDLKKQEIFLEKALDIDPNNIPAQRGMAYLQKRKQRDTSIQNDHLSDYTKPISPFPSSDRMIKPQNNEGGKKPRIDNLENIVNPDNEPIETQTQVRSVEEPIRLTPVEISMLGVVVIVFCFIGLLASSAIFRFDLPLGFLVGDRPRLTTNPPYPGVFLYENGILSDIQRYEGMPDHDSGIPNCFEFEPVIVFWQTEVNPDELRLIHETGEYIPFQVFQGKGNLHLIKPEVELQPGLHCFQQIMGLQTHDEAFYWCFRTVTPQ